MPAWHRFAVAAFALALLVGCDTGSADVVPSPSPQTPVPTATAEPSATPGVATVEPAPGSDSAVYPPNPDAIVVAIDAGHGGCLDWGVPDPSQRGVELAEKTLTLGMAQRLRDRLEADGIGVLMIRDGDEALAGDLEPDYGCDGAPFRDVDGDGNAGFEETGRIRTRDELQARIDLANLAQADAFVSIHINSPTEGGEVIEIAFGQTFYDDETPWGPEASAALAEAIHRGTIEAIDPLTTYNRQDRGTDAVAYYAISRTWAEGDTCEREGDTYCKPRRGLLMPGALAEVGSITLRAEHDLLASEAGMDAVADGLFTGLVEYFGGRVHAARIALAEDQPGIAPEPLPGTGPPYWPQIAPDASIELRVTNTGNQAWPAGSRLLAGWQATSMPYLAGPAEVLNTIGPPLPALEPGESVVVTADLPPAPAGVRAVAWVSLTMDGASLTDLGSPALQMANRAP